MLSEETRKYINYLIEWISSKCDIELDPLTQYEIIRVIMDSAEMFEKEK